MSNETIIDALSPVLARIKTLDLGQPDAAKAALEAEFPLDGPVGTSLRELSERGLNEGWLCGKEAGDSKFSRIAKVDAGNGFSIDAVMLWGDGPWHKHTKGEVNLMFKLEGEPKFCGHTEGWAVFAPESQHVPSVKDGKMLILYMLPDGAVEWKKA